MKKKLLVTIGIILVSWPFIILFAVLLISLIQKSGLTMTALSICTSGSIVIGCTLMVAVRDNWYGL